MGFVLDRSFYVFFCTEGLVGPLGRGLSWRDTPPLSHAWPSPLTAVIWSQVPKRNRFRKPTAHNCNLESRVWVLQCLLNTDCHGLCLYWMQDSYHTHNTKIAYHSPLFISDRSIILQLLQECSLCLKVCMVQHQCGLQAVWMVQQGCGTCRHGSHCEP